MHLGQVLDRLTDETVATQTLVDLDDLLLLARVNAVARDHDLSMGQTIAHAVHTCTSQADGDSWVQLMSAINRAKHPGREALKLMLEASLPAH